VRRSRRSAPEVPFLFYDFSRVPFLVYDFLRVPFLFYVLFLGLFMFCSCFLIRSVDLELFLACDWALLPRQQRSIDVSYISLYISAMARYSSFPMSLQ
jgi:hypothetical protein